MDELLKRFQPEILLLEEARDQLFFDQLLTHSNGNSLSITYDRAPMTPEGLAFEELERRDGGENEFIRTFLMALLVRTNQDLPVRMRILLNRNARMK